MVPVPSDRQQLMRSLVLTLLIVSVLHGISYYLGLGDAQRTIGLGLAAVITLGTVSLGVTTWQLVALWLLGAAQAATFVFVLMQTQPPFPYRPLLVLTISLYMVLIVLTAGVLQVRPRARAVLKVAIALPAAALVIETLSTFYLPEPVTSAVVEAQERVRYRGRTQEHPTIGPIPVPNSVTETVYPDNPRGYFWSRGSAWRLLRQPSNDAELNASGQQVAVRIDRAGEPTPWHIQLALEGLEVEEGGEYVLSFRARATGARGLAFGVSMAHAPWEGLGLYQTMPIGTEWMPVTRSFTARLSDAAARVTFDLGGDTADVHIADLVVRRSDQAVILDGSRPDYFVTTVWNSGGCRGPEYAVSPPPGTFRILALGGSYTEGVGVHAEDTFTEVMEGLLRDRAAEAGDPRRFEVVNCGVRGLSTREQRLYYEDRVRSYQPNLVLVVVSLDADRSLQDVVDPDVAREIGEWERLLHSLRLVELIRREQSAASPASAMGELTRLSQMVAADGGELAMVLFNDAEDREWNRWVESAESTAATLHVPLLDLTGIFTEYDWSTQLAVHPIDDHPNEAAHELVANATVEWLEMEGLLRTQQPDVP